MNRPKKLTTWIVLGTLAVIVALAALTLVTPTPRSYSFVTEDHPVDMWKDGPDKWAYYSIGTGTSKELAGKVRIELTLQGFTEDTTRAPWFRFVKGNEEVVVCNHDEFEVNGSPTGSQLAKHRPPPVAYPHQEWPCVLVKNGPGTDTDVSAFQIKKLVYRW